MLDLLIVSFEDNECCFFQKEPTIQRFFLGEKLDLLCSVILSTVLKFLKLQTRFEHLFGIIYGRHRRVCVLTGSNWNLKHEKIKSVYFLCWCIAKSSESFKPHTGMLRRLSSPYLPRCPLHCSVQGDKRTDSTLYPPLLLWNVVAKTRLLSARDFFLAN